MKQQTIREARLQAGLSVRALAEAACIGTMQVKRAEGSGDGQKVSQHTLDLLQDILARALDQRARAVQASRGALTRH